MGDSRDLRDGCRVFVAGLVITRKVKASTGYLQGLEAVDILPWLNLIIVFDVIFTAVAFMVFDYVVEE